MRSLVRASFVACLLTTPALTAFHAKAADEPKKELQVGATAPEFEAIDDQGQTWLSSEHVGSKYLVVYFYPGDFTPGCTKQAQIVRDNMNKLKEAGIEVVGVSGDAAETHALFKKAQMLNFTLLADASGNLAKQFGVPLNAGGEVKAKDAEGKVVTLKREVTAARWTFIIGKDGKVLYKNTKVNPAEDSKQVVAFIESLEKKQ